MPIGGLRTGFPFATVGLPFIERRCGEMADAQDLKSWVHKKTCGFESHHRHHVAGKPGAECLSVPSCRATDNQRRRNAAKMNLSRKLPLGTLMMLMVTASQCATVSFSGHTWVVRSSGRGGPGPNYWEPNNVSVDSNGYLHLRLTQQDGKWSCAELHTQERLGFGRYEFWLTGPVDRLDRNVVLGLFNYPTSDVGLDGTHEIDIEFAQWGISSAAGGNYTVWRATNSLRRESKAFALRLEGDSSEHSFTWASTNVVFESHEERAGVRTRQLATWVFRPRNPAACISREPMPIHINLWCFRGQPPSDGKEVELIVRAFKFTPL